MFIDSQENLEGTPLILRSFSCRVRGAEVFPKLNIARDTMVLNRCVYNVRIVE